MNKKEFDFARLLTLVAGVVGTMAFFFTFYQVESFFTQTSGFNIAKEGIAMLTGQPTDGLVNELFNKTNPSEITYWLPTIIVLLIPILFFLIGVELLIRAFYLKTAIVHRVWMIVFLSLLGIGLCWWISSQSTFEFYFFESVQRGYWWGIWMALFSLVAHFIDDW